MTSIEFFNILSCCLLMFCQQKTMAQFGGIGYYPYNYNRIGGIFGNGYSAYGYYPQYPTYGSYPCFTSIYCGREYGSGYGGFPSYSNGFNAAFSSSSSTSIGFSFLLNGFFG